MNSDRPKLTLLGQTPPPWHGQAVATQILFDHDWPDFEVERIRMGFSEDMHEVGRFQFKKLRLLIGLIIRTRRSLASNPHGILFYPPASARWVPFLRDVVFLFCTRPKAAKTVFIFHASGLAEFTQKNWLGRKLARLAYHDADMAMEVSEEKNAPHTVFHARQHQWCPCAIKVPEMPRQKWSRGEPLEILFVGSLQEGKGILEIMKTAGTLKQLGVGAGFHFNIVGQWFCEKFKQKALTMHRELDVMDMVSLRGQLTGADKWQAYAQGDVFFFPTHYHSEATPIVLMEALGMGMPIVSTTWAGIPAMLQGCETARLFPIRSPVRYAEALVDIKRDLEMGAAFEEASKQYYYENYVPDRFIRRVENAIKECYETGYCK